MGRTKPVATTSTPGTSPLMTSVGTAAKMQATAIPTAPVDRLEVSLATPRKRRRPIPRERAVLHGQRWVVAQSREQDRQASQVFDAPYRVSWPTGSGSEGRARIVSSEHATSARPTW